MINEWLTLLTNVAAPTGDERKRAKVIEDQVKQFVDEVHYDALGNLYAVKHAKNKNSDHETIVLSAHLDEPACTIVDIDEAGFLRVEGIGQQDPIAWIGRRVRISKTGQIGIIDVEEQVDWQDITFGKLYIDLAARDQEHAKSLASIGDFVSLVGEFDEEHDDVYLGTHLDSVLPCALLLEVLKTPVSDKEIIAVFTVQHRVRSRGAKVAGYQVDADLVLTLGLTPTGDTPGAKRSAIKLGAGPAIKALDGSMVVSNRVRDRLMEAFSRAGVMSQIEVAPKVMSDTGAFFLTKAGTPAGGLSVPVRHAKQQMQIAAKADVEALRNVLIALIK